MLYQTLFNINLLHAYFLDIGEKKYHIIKPDLSSENELSSKEIDIVEKAYKSSLFLKLIPNGSTSRALRNYKLMLRNHSKGMRVLVGCSKEISEEGILKVDRFAPFIELPNDLTLTFFIKINDVYFENYTDIIKKSKKQLYYLSNKASSAINIFTASRDIKKWSSFLVSEKESRRLVYELEKENQLNINIPKRVTIADIKSKDIDTIEAKILNYTPLSIEEIESLEALNTRIQVLKNKGIIGVVRIKIAGDNNCDLTETVTVKNANTTAFNLRKRCLLKTPFNFQIYIENKKTYWRYHLAKSDSRITTATPLPLTKNGKVEVDRMSFNPPLAVGAPFFPNPTVESITLDADNQNYYSEIFI